MEILGLIDALEATVLSSPKVLLTNKTIIDEKKILNLIDKMRIVIKNDESKYVSSSTAEDEYKQISTVSRTDVLDQPSPPKVSQDTLDDVDKIIFQAKEQAGDIIESADSYAMQVLEKLHLSVLKMQRNIVRAEKTIKDSKESIKDPAIKEEVSGW